MSGSSVGAPDHGPWEPVAVVGLSCRLPGARTPEAFWRLLCEGREAISPPPARMGEHSAERDGLWGGYLDNAEDFDAAFFGISPREALAMDPQQRLMLELSWEAVESSARRPARCAVCAWACSPVPSVPTTRSCTTGAGPVRPPITRSRAHTGA